MRTRTTAASTVLAATIALAGCGGSDQDRGTVTDAATPPAVETPASTTETDVGAETETTTTPSEPEPTKPQPTAISIRVLDGRPQGGIARPKVDLGDRVVLVVRSDTADEVHLHGYDVSRPVAAGGSARLAFVATIPGRFEVELEQSGVQIAELTVR